MRQNTDSDEKKQSRVINRDKVSKWWMNLEPFITVIKTVNLRRSTVKSTLFDGVNDLRQLKRRAQG